MKLASAERTWLRDQYLPRFFHLFHTVAYQHLVPPDPMSKRNKPLSQKRYIETIVLDAFLRHFNRESEVREDWCSVEYSVFLLFVKLTSCRSSHDP